jgi:hypothetical protein
MRRREDDGAKKANILGSNTTIKLRWGNKDAWIKGRNDSGMILGGK